VPPIGALIVPDVVARDAERLEEHLVPEGVNLAHADVVR
jgi:hypothetical protein